MVRNCSKSGPEKSFHLQNRWKLKTVKEMMDKVLSYEDYIYSKYIDIRTHLEYNICIYTYMLCIYLMYMYISTGWPIVSMNSTVRKSTFHIPGMKSQMNLTIFRCYYHIWNSGMKIQPNRWFYMNELCSFCLYHYNNFAYQFGIFIFSNMLYHLVSIRFEWFFLPSRVSQWRMVRSSLVAVPCWLRCFWECWVSPLMWPWCCWRLVPHSRREQNIQESIKNLMGPYQRTLFSKLRSSYY